MSHSKSLTVFGAIVYGGLIAGVLDAADGVVACYLAQGFNPIQVLLSDIGHIVPNDNGI